MKNLEIKLTATIDDGTTIVRKVELGKLELNDLELGDVIEGQESVVKLFRDEYFKLKADVGNYEEWEFSNSRSEAEREQDLNSFIKTPSKAELINIDYDSDDSVLYRERNLADVRVEDVVQNHLKKDLSDKLEEVSEKKNFRSFTKELIANGYDVSLNANSTVSYSDNNEEIVDAINQLKQKYEKLAKEDSQKGEDNTSEN